MVLDLKRIFSGLERERSFAHSLDLSELEIGGLFPFSLPVSLSGRIVSHSGMIRLDYEACFLFRTRCFRCTEEFDEEYHFSFHHLLTVALTGENEDRYFIVENEVLDLDEVAYTDILLELPTKYLCAPDCKGICPQCGQNLNEGACECRRGDIDPRLEALKQLLD